MLTNTTWTDRMAQCYKQVSREGGALQQGSLNNIWYKQRVEIGKHQMKRYMKEQESRIKYYDFFLKFLNRNSFTHLKS